MSVFKISTHFSGAQHLHRFQPHVTHIKTFRANRAGGQEPEPEHEKNSLAGVTRQDGMY